MMHPQRTSTYERPFALEGNYLVFVICSKRRKNTRWECKYQYLLLLCYCHTSCDFSYADLRTGVD